MHFSYFNSNSNTRKRNIKLIRDELLNKYSKTKNNILFDEYVKNITKKKNISNNDNTQEIKIDSKITKKLNLNLRQFLKTESNKTKYNGTNHIKELILDNKNLFNSHIKNINLYKNFYNCYQDLNKNNKIYKNKLVNFFNIENDTIIESFSNNNLLKKKLKDFLATSKDSFNKENNFNNKMKEVIQKLRFFNLKNNLNENNLNIPKIKYNRNHNYCFSLSKLTNNNKNSYTITNNKIKTKNKIINKSLSINNSRYRNKDNYIFNRNSNNLSVIKLNKKVAKSINGNNQNNLRENIIKKILRNNNIIKRNWINDQNQKLFFIENYLNKNDLSNKDNNFSKTSKTNRNKKIGFNNKIFKSLTINKKNEIKYMNINLSYIRKKHENKS